MLFSIEGSCERKIFHVLRFVFLTVNRVSYLLLAYDSSVSYRLFISFICEYLLIDFMIQNGCERNRCDCNYIVCSSLKFVNCDIVLCSDYALIYIKMNFLFAFAAWIAALLRKLAMSAPLNLQVISVSIKILSYDNAALALCFAVSVLFS